MKKHNFFEGQLLTVDADGKIVPFYLSQSCEAVGFVKTDIGTKSDDDDEENEESNDAEEFDIEYPDMPTLANLKSDFQVLDYSDFTNFLSSVFTFQKYCGDFSCELFKEHVLDVGSSEEVGNETEQEYVRNTRESCKISYVEYMICGQIEYLSHLDISPEYVIMSREYFLFMVNLVNKYLEKIEDVRYYESFVNGKVFGLKILISKNSKTPLVIHDPSKFDFKNKSQDPNILSNKKLIETFPDIFNDKGRIRSEAIWAENIVQPG